MTCGCVLRTIGGFDIGEAWDPPWPRGNWIPMSKSPHASVASHLRARELGKRVVGKSGKMPRGSRFKLVKPEILAKAASISRSVALPDKA